MTDIVKPDLDDVEKAQERLIKQLDLRSDDAKDVDQDWMFDR